MPALKISAFILVLLAACGQVSESHSGRSVGTTDNEDSPVYQRIMSEICDCATKTMKNNKPSKQLDSCQEVVVQRYTKRLKQQGLDPATPKGKERLETEIIENFQFECRELTELYAKEKKEEEAKRLIFTGPALAEKRLPNGNYEIVILDNKTKARKTLIYEYPILGSTRVKVEPGAELEVEYKISHNKKTNKDEYHVVNASLIEEDPVIKVLPVEQ